MILLRLTQLPASSAKFKSGNTLNTDTLKKFSEEIGEEYDIFPLAVPHYDEMQSRVGELINNYLATVPDRNIQIVEGGCGTGLTTRYLVEADPKITVVAIDNEKVMLEQAEKALAKYADRITFVQEDLLHSIAKMKDVKIFVSGFCIHNLPPDYRRELFKEIGRALAPAALFINCDKIAHDNEDEHRQALKEQVEAFHVFTEHGKPELEDEWTKHYIELDDPIRLTETEQIDALSLAGFTNIEWVFRRRMDAIVQAIKK